VIDLLTDPAAVGRAAALWDEFTREEQAELAALNPVLWGLYASPPDTFAAPPHICYLGEVLTKVSRNELTRVAISVPPQHGKSTLVSKFYPSWHLGRNPSERVILCSYGQELTVGWTGAGRDLLAEHGPAVFDIETWARAKRTSWDAFRGGRRTGGSMRGVGKGGGVTGYAVDLGICDDLVKDASEVASLAQREALWRWFESAVLTRARRLIVMATRWHTDDVIGRLKKKQAAGEVGEPWVFINIPAIAEDDDPLGRARGDPLWLANPLAHGDPEWYSKKEREVGEFVWNALYQGRPTPAEGGLFKQGWLRPYKADDEILVAGNLRVPLARPRRFSTVDLAGSKKERADYTVIATWGIDVETKTLWLLDLVRKRLEAPAIVAELRDVQQRMKPVAFYVERAAPQLNLLHKLKFAEAAGETIDPKDDAQEVLVANAVAAGLPVVRLDPGSTDKRLRAAPATAVMAAGRLMTPERAPWLGEWKAEVFEFPEVKHDDQVDTMSYGVQVFLEVLQAHAAAARATRDPNTLPIGGTLRV
jgi:predicted phage terminase large subunit-like protein